VNRWALLASAAAISALAWWAWEPHVRAETPSTTVSASQGAVGNLAALPRAPALAASSAPFTAPFTAQGARERAAQAALWRERFERATQTLETYRQHSRYPQGSRPAAEQADQLQPYAPVIEDHALKMPGQAADETVKLRAMQERIYLQGEESAQVTLALVDAQGQAQALRVVRASLREVTAATQGSLFPVVPALFNDEGSGADSAAGDRVFSTRVQPSTQGFAQLSGQLRLEVHLQHGNHAGFAYFDFYVTATPPALWSGPVRESTDGGSLNFDLPVQVKQAGRYVVTGVVDDAHGAPYAHLTYNDELPAGPGQVRLMLFGKLMHDAPPAFPLTLRDVVAFRLNESGHPDRAHLPERRGSVHTSARHPLAAFSSAEWMDDARQRYLAELSKDAEQARRRLAELGG
jgi:hypothetical protein